MATTRAAADMVLPTSSAPPLTPRRSASLRPREALSNVLHSWISRQFLFGCAILFPIAVTVFVMIAVFRFFEDFFSPLYRAIGLPFFGLGFMTSMAFIFLVGLLGSSWAGAAALSVSEWIIKRLPLARHVYSAAKQVVSGRVWKAGGESYKPACARPAVGDSRPTNQCLFPPLFTFSPPRSNPPTAPAARARSANASWCATRAATS